MLNVRLLAMALLVAGSFTLLADEPIPVPDAPHPAVKSRNRVYAVADLVVPARNDLTPGQFSPAVSGQPMVTIEQCRSTQEDRLIDLITSKVQPHCWTKSGGPCVIQFYPIGMGLVVNGPDDVQAEVAAMLDSLRKSQDATISVGLQFMTVSTDFLERFGLNKDLNIQAWQACECCESSGKCCQWMGCGCCGEDCPCGDCGCCLEQTCCTEATPVALTPRQAQLLLDAIKADANACITDAPRVTMADGQTATVSSQQSQQFVTGLKIQSINGEVRATPEITPFNSGVSTTLRGSVSADRRYVGLHIESSYSCLENDTVPMSTVSVELATATEDNRDHSSMELKHAIQRPKFKTLTIDTDLKIPSGGSMLIYGGQIERTQHILNSIPVLSKIPGLGQFFTHRSNESTTEHLLVMVTPQIACDLPEQAASAAHTVRGGIVQTGVTPVACGACIKTAGNCFCCPNCPSPNGAKSAACSSPRPMPDCDDQSACKKCPTACNDTILRTWSLKNAPAAIVANQIQQWNALRYNDETIVRTTVDVRSNSLTIQAPADVADWISTAVSWIDSNWFDGAESRIIKLRNTLSDEMAAAICPMTCGQLITCRAISQPGLVHFKFTCDDPSACSKTQREMVDCVRITSEVRSNSLIVLAAPKYFNLVAAIVKAVDVVAAARPTEVDIYMLTRADASQLAALIQQVFVKDETASVPPPQMRRVDFYLEPGNPTRLETKIAVDERTNTLIVTGSPKDRQTIAAMISCLDNLGPDRMRLVFKLRRTNANDVAMAVQTFAANAFAAYRDKGCLSANDAQTVCVPESVSNTVLVDTTPLLADRIKAIIEALDAAPESKCGVAEEASAPPAAAPYAKSPVELRAAKKAETLVRQYREACARGEAEAARLIAHEALDLDPECFAKPCQPLAAGTCIPPAVASPLPAIQACPSPAIQACPAPAVQPCPRPVSKFEMIYDNDSCQSVVRAASALPILPMPQECPILQQFGSVPMAPYAYATQFAHPEIATHLAPYGLPYFVTDVSWPGSYSLLPWCSTTRQVGAWPNDQPPRSIWVWTQPPVQIDPVGAGCLEPEECEPPQKDAPTPAPGKQFKFESGFYFRHGGGVQTVKPMIPPER
jgi:type II secretory pathway component GspD/PulD (secretin)